MTQSYEIMHKNILYIIANSEENNNFYKDKYFKLCYDYIINNTFDENYIIDLMNSNFLVTIKIKQETLIL